jgi:predicted small integral membrane protein
MAQPTFAQEEALRVSFLTIQECLYQVAVLVKGTNWNTIWQEIRNQSSPSQILIFSYIGMETKEVSNINISKR